MNWYQTLAKPPLTPPDWIFAPVWTVLYVLIGFSLVLFMRARSSEKKGFPFMMFLLQMIFNLLWTVVFFDMKNPVFGLAVLSALIAFLLLTIVRFYPISKPAAFLLMPYFIWCCFALYLNGGIVWLN